MPRKINTRAYIKVLQALTVTPYPSDVAQNLGISKQLLNYYLKRLEQWGYVKKINSYPRMYELTSEGIKLLNASPTLQEQEVKRINGVSVGKPPGTDIDVHDLRFTVSIVKPGDIPHFMKKTPGPNGVDRWISDQKEIMRWSKKYSDHNYPDFLVELYKGQKQWSLVVRINDLRVRVTTPDQLLNNIMTTVWKVMHIVEKNFRRYGWVLDPGSIDIRYHHIAWEIPKPVQGKIARTSIKLGERVQTPTTTIDREARVWTDGSPYADTQETDTYAYARDYLLMPKRVRILTDEMLGTVREIYGSLEIMNMVLSDLGQAIKKLKMPGQIEPSIHLN